MKLEFLDFTVLVAGCADSSEMLLATLLLPFTCRWLWIGYMQEFTEPPSKMSGVLRDFRSCLASSRLSHPVLPMSLLQLLSLSILVPPGMLNPYVLKLRSHHNAMICISV